MIKPTTPAPTPASTPIKTLLTPRQPASERFQPQRGQREASGDILPKQSGHWSMRLLQSACAGQSTKKAPSVAKGP